MELVEGFKENYFMSRYIEKEIKCICCEKSYKTRILVSFYHNGTPDLDTNLHNPLIYNRIVFCPYCGYAFSKFYTEPSPKIRDQIRELVKNSNYQEWVKKDYDSVAKKLILSAYLEAQMKNNKAAGYNYLLAYWRLKEIKSKDVKEVCKKAIDNISQYLLRNKDIGMAMILVDLLRQNGSFAESKETLSSLEEYIDKDNKLLMAIAKFERKLIEQKDQKEHKISEVEI